MASMHKMEFGGNFVPLANEVSLQALLAILVCKGVITESELDEAIDLVLAKMGRKPVGATDG